jgi:hypothetical protein
MGDILKRIDGNSRGYCLVVYWILSCINSSYYDMMGQQIDAYIIVNISKPKAPAVVVRNSLPVQEVYRLTKLRISR